MRKSRLNSNKQVELIEHFVAGETARSAADLVGVNRKTAAYYYHRLRSIIIEQLNQDADSLLNGGIEVGLVCFVRQSKDQIRRETDEKIPLFYIIKCEEKIYTKVVKTFDSLFVESDTLIPHSIGVLTEDNRLDISEFKCYWIDEVKVLNEVESFWSQTKCHLRKFNGIPREHFPLFLKECEWRFNNPKARNKLTQLKQWVKREMG